MDKNPVENFGESFEVNLSDDFGLFSGRLAEPTYGQDS